jgi:hypothetical protein
MRSLCSSQSSALVEPPSIPIKILPTVHSASERLKHSEAHGAHVRRRAQSGAAAAAQ